MIRFFIIASLIAAMVSAHAQNQVVVYPTDSSVLSYHNDDFDVQVRTPDGKWQSVFVYTVKVDKVIDRGHSVENASMAAFDFSGAVEIKIVYNKGAIENARVRPLSRNITPQIAHNTLRFKLTNPSNLSVEVNGDIFHNLHLFANPIEKEKPNINDPNVILFGPGVHEIKNQKLEVESGKTVYLAGGAVLKGQISLEDVSDVKILGRGMVDQDIRLGVHISNSKNIEVEGIFASQCAIGGSDGVQVQNVKTISYFGWGDGLNVFASSNVSYERVFVRSSDDSHTVYATRKGFEGDARNITMKDATLWADVAHPIMIGIHGNSENPDTISNLTYTNIDILDHKETQIDYQGCMTINAGDNNMIEDVLFEDIRVEDFRQGQLVNLRIFYNEKYCTAPGQGIRNITFRDVVYNGKNAELSIISGYNSHRRVENITFENLIINDQLIHDEMEGKPAWYKTGDLARIFIGEHVEGVRFIKTK